MGRRSINTTKSGKYMNPTDQARKEARKKELKKNKKQRQMVRQAVLKGKDPLQIIAEMEKIDSMELNVVQPAPLNEKVLKDKRRKLRETLDRVIKLYEKEDGERLEEVKRVEADYERRRATLLSYSESVRHAQQVEVDDIPLPLAGGIPLPDVAPPGILRKRYHPPQTLHKRPPGVPPHPPPILSSDEEDDTNEVEEKKHRLIRFADSVQIDIPPPPPAISHPRLEEGGMGSLPAPTGQLPPGLPPGRPLGVLGMRPPGPPPGLPPRLLPPIRLPPGPPPGLPRLLPPGLPRVLPPRLTPNVLTAGPQLIRKESAVISSTTGPTIEAKAQIRNLGGDVTRFVPTALRVKRGEVRQPIRQDTTQQQNDKPAKPIQTKDDAYSQFMKEMQGLL